MSEEYLTKSMESFQGKLHGYLSAYFVDGSGAVTKREDCFETIIPLAFQQLAEDIQKADEEGSTKEIELTSALESVRGRTGMIGVRLYSQRYDMGNPGALVDTIAKFSHL